MALQTAERKMGRPKGTGTSDRDDVAVKVDRKIVAKARIIAADRGVSLAQALSDLLAGPVEREYAKIVRKLGDND